ncbi:hypothetical protein WJR50_03555 [Catalinimonas sp. 4WD22]|uniref:hypothetical protein n=1 Tax=Catalinimonas locisalis TaxID=3133978 RepID=UPI003101A72B
MRKIIIILLISVTSVTAYAQSSMDFKLGFGASNLGTGDKLVGKLEGEVSRKWNRILSNSILLGVGYGDFYSRMVPQPTNDPTHVTYREREFNPSFLTHLDANVFASPFRNDKIYNLKIGTGASLIYVYDNIDSDREEHKVSLGMSAIVENEFSLKNGFLLGLKAMMQPYLNGDINLSLMLKVGKEI